MSFLRFHNFLNAKARLIVSNILFYFLSEKVYIIFPLKKKKKQMYAFASIHTFIIFQDWLFSCTYWLTQTKTGCTWALLYKIRAYIRWLRRESYFNTSIRLMTLRCSDDTQKLTWGLMLSDWHLSDVNQITYSSFTVVL